MHHLNPRIMKKSNMTISIFVSLSFIITGFPSQEINRKSQKYSPRALDKKEYLIIIFLISQRNHMLRRFR